MTPRKRKLFWCGDESFRGCILRNIFTKLGFRVLLPTRPPNPSTKKLPKKGSTFQLAKVTEFLERRGGNEIGRVDRTWNVASNGKGDIDIAVDLGQGVAYVAEVKTRLIPRSISNHGIEKTILMLQYHLDEPNGAEKAWQRLVAARIVRPPKPGRRGDYDNPASIAELTRAVVGFHLIRPNYKSIIPGVATMCYATPFIQDIFQYVTNTYRYLKYYGLPVEKPAVIVVYPDNFSGIPSRVAIRCIGEGCHRLRLDPAKTISFSFEALLRDCPNYHSCNECKYQRLCAKHCSESP